MAAAAEYLGQPMIAKIRSGGGGVIGTNFVAKAKPDGYTLLINSPTTIIAKPLIEGMIEKGKIPIIVGGTGLYVKALIDGLFPSPPKDERFRKKMEDKVK